jgi:hypothetical protein
MWIAPRVQFSGRPSGAPSELDANLIRRHIYHINNPSLKKPNLRPRAITYFQPFLVQRLGSTSPRKSFLCCLQQIGAEVSFCADQAP